MEPLPPLSAETALEASVLEANGMQGPLPLQDYRVVTYDRFLDTLIDLDAHLTSVVRPDPTNAYPSPPAC